MAVERLVADGDGVREVRCLNEEHRKEILTADAYVVALGSYSPFLLRPLRVPCLIYPAKGYSATIAIGGHRGAPTVSLTDLAWKIVFTRLCDRLRVAGTAELSGYDRDLNLVRCEALVKRTFELFPDAGEQRQRAVLDGIAARHAFQRAAGRRTRATAISTSIPATARSGGRWPAAPDAPWRT